MSLDVSAAGGMSPLLVDDIADLDERRWNRLATDCAPARYEFVGAVDAGRARATYRVIADGEAYHCAARLSFAADRGRALGSVLYGRAAAAVARLGLQIGDAVICGWPHGCGRNILVDGRLPATVRTDLLHRMCDAVESAAAGRVVVFPGVLADDAVLAGILEQRGYRVASGLPIACLDVGWRDLDGYLSALQRKSRSWGRAARHEVNRYRRSGAVVERLTRGADEWERVCELLNGHHERLNGHSPGHEPAKLRRLAEALGEDFTVYVSRHEGVITGVTVGARHGSDAMLTWIGVDYAAAGDNFTYFNVAYYAPIDDLTRLGVRRIWLGNAAYEAKIRRGCRILPSQIYVRLPTNLATAAHAPIFALQRAWYRRKFRRFVTAPAP